MEDKILKNISNDFNTSQVFFLPVRHHSPAAARAVNELIDRLQPAAILIEGPSDFNQHINELFLPHRLPLAVYCYFRDAGGERRGAFYPFITYSPEWQALQKGHSIGAEVMFIDLPWSYICHLEAALPNLPERPVLEEQRYADVHLRRSSYITRLCKEVGVDDFDGLWDELFEIDPELSCDEYVLRARTFCDHCRQVDIPDPIDIERERFMARQILECMDKYTGSILVITGGYHTSALEALITQKSIIDEPNIEVDLPADYGSAITPFSNERLDSLTGYKSGMPGPGFYEFVWEDRSINKSFDYSPLLVRLVNSLREKGVLFSTADLIAASSTCRALADLRGHRDVWRRDIIDGLRGSLIKDDLARGGTHPLLDVISEIFRGNGVGRLAQGTTVPQLMREIETILEELSLTPTEKQRVIELNLNRQDDRKRSRVLHCLRILGISGFSLTGGIDISSGTYHADVQEEWSIKWIPEFASSVIEAASLGPCLIDAASAALVESADKAGRDIEKASQLLVDATLAGLGGKLGKLTQRLEAMIRFGYDFPATTMVLDNLLYLYSYNTVLELENRESMTDLFIETYRRCLYLLENLGVSAQGDKRYVDGIRGIAAVYERCAGSLGLTLEETGGVFKRVKEDREQSPMLRGAAAGTLLSLKLIENSSILSDLRLFYDPGLMGDYLTGLFALARETIQRDKNFLTEIDRWLIELNDDEFLEAVPSLRLAFTYFTPREKYYLSMQLLDTQDTNNSCKRAIADKSPEDLIVNAEQALLSLRFENKLYETLSKYGLKGGTDAG
ncbi:DUF5682 family protein [Pseudobacteroides cellulosolvens]|uniref:4-aminobutyrate aminotransferase n=1 Tax=Pseudobacteroides cellulosolvens ATCC 35603 = DSM 2933 TaxID=398512 RepID=A0A0L6JMB1_9FIRM|nr:DUF5682 family protein [Pseudobacteroides cellulosolvens]KNY26893.1 hypothetical protein Bccel_2158 [Pseudobacteroides cellulosolvens ATCC 35603 = DSM 2933]